MSQPKWRFQTFKSGHVGDDKKPKKLLPNGVQANEEEEDEGIQTNDSEDEKLLPLGVGKEKVQTNNDEDETGGKALYPTGVNPKN